MKTADDTYQGAHTRYLIQLNLDITKSLKLALCCAIFKFCSKFYLPVVALSHDNFGSNPDLFLHLIRRNGARMVFCCALNSRTIVRIHQTRVTAAGQ